MKTISEGPEKTCRKCFEDYRNSEPYLARAMLGLGDCACIERGVPFPVDGEACPDGPTLFTVAELSVPKKEAVRKIAELCALLDDFQKKWALDVLNNPECQVIIDCSPIRSLTAILDKQVVGFWHLVEEPGGDAVGKAAYRGKRHFEMIQRYVEAGWFCEPVN